MSPICQKLSFSSRRKMRSLRDAGDLLPELRGFVVFPEDRDVELVLGEAEFLRDQFPGEVDGFGLEVVAEGEVAEHLEEGVMAAGVADVLQIVVLAAGADALLRGGCARVVALLAPRKTSLNWFMPALVKSRVGSLAGTSEEDADDAVAALGKEIEEALADLVACHGGVQTIVADDTGRDAAAERRGFNAGAEDAAKRG